MKVTYFSSNFHSVLSYDACKGQLSQSPVFTPTGFLNKIFLWNFFVLYLSLDLFFFFSQNTHKPIEQCRLKVTSQQKRQVHVAGSETSVTTAGQWTKSSKSFKTAKITVKLHFFFTVNASLESTQPHTNTHSTSLAHLLVNGFEFLQRLFACDGVDQDEGVTFRDGQALHGRELVAPCGVGDLEGAHALIAADHLAVGVLHCGDVGVPEGALHEAQDQGALPHSPCPEHHHTIVVALLWHSAPFRLKTVLHLRC